MDADPPARDVLRLVTTTSTRDSGLLDKILPVFEKANKCRVDVVAVGTGAALKLGEAGESDVVLVHARAAEQAFMQAKHGVRQEEFMANYFTIVGPKNDPAQIRAVGPVAALQKIAERNERFVSRGDDSGTHKREVRLWEQSGGRPSWDNYVESGQGMGPTLVMTDQMQGYVLTDIGTYLNFQDKITLVPLMAESESLRNPYTAIVVNPKKHEKIHEELAQTFVEFLISDECQRLISGYQIGGQQLFQPTRLNGD